MKLILKHKCEKKKVKTFNNQNFIMYIFLPLKGTVF